MTNGEMNARWMNAEIATCAIAGRAANWPRGQSRPWKGHIVIVLDPFFISAARPSQRNTSRTQTRQWKGSLTLLTSAS